MFNPSQSVADLCRNAKPPQPVPKHGAKSPRLFHLPVDALLSFFSLDLIHGLLLCEILITRSLIHLGTVACALVNVTFLSNMLSIPRAALGIWIVRDTAWDIVQSLRVDLGRQRVPSTGHNLCTGCVFCALFRLARY